MFVADPAQGTLGPASYTSRKSQWHAVDISAWAGLRCVDIRMSVNVDNCHFLAHTSLSDCFRHAGKCANGYGVVTAECQDWLALSCMRVHCMAQLFGKVTDRGCPVHPDLSINVLVSSRRLRATIRNVNAIETTL